MDTKRISWIVLLLDLVLLLVPSNVVVASVPEHVCCYIKKLLTSLEGIRLKFAFYCNLQSCLNMHLHIHLQVKQLVQ